MASNSLVFLIVLLAVTFVMYKAASGHPNLVENWGWTMTAMNSTVNRTQNGASSFGNNQQQLFSSNNQVINPNLLNEAQRNVVAQSISSPAVSTVSAGGAGQENSDTGLGSVVNSQDLWNTIEGYKQTQGDQAVKGPQAGFPVYTVPGTYQADLSPRFNSVGLNSYVKYNVPEQDHLASYANDPLTMEHRPSQENYAPMDLVNMVERPTVREDYKSSKSASKSTSEPAEYNQMVQKLADMGSQVTDKLPVQPMNGSHGSDKEPIYYNADRYIFAMQKSRLYGRADFIRGDIPIVPTLPNADINSNVWFRPSVTPRTDLNAGALGVIGGTYNTTQQQLLEMMARSAGGSMGTINGVDVNPINTPANTVQQNISSQVSQLTSQAGVNQGNKWQQLRQSLKGAPGAVSTRS